jgi:hypothetical protein
VNAVSVKTNRRGRTRPKSEPTRATIESVSVPEIAEHGVGEIPLANAAERFALMEWGMGRRVVRAGRAISFPVEAHEVELARFYAIEELSRDDRDPECSYTVSTRYDARTKQLWAWDASGPWSDATVRDTIA